MKNTLARRASFEVAHLCFCSRIRENSGRVLIAKRLNSHDSATFLNTVQLQNAQASEMDSKFTSLRVVLVIPKLKDELGSIEFVRWALWLWVDRPKGSERLFRSIPE